MESSQKAKCIVGWIAVTITVAFTNLWTYWGVVENFHEGWYSESLLENLAMLLIQYLLFTIVFCGLAILSIRWPKAGLGLHIAIAIFLAWFFRSATFNVVGLMIVIPIIGLGVMYFWGRPEPRKWAYWLIIILPVIVILSITPFKMIQLNQRIDDGDYGMRVVQGNDVSLVWAPKGPGWPDGGVSYNEAVERCKYLSEDGTELLEEEQNIWRLPTVDEAVRSMMLHNENAGGVWDKDTEKASYVKTPDKETPLWKPHSMIIYYWTYDSCGLDRAYIIVYDGGVFTRLKDKAYGYLSFRAVK